MDEMIDSHLAHNGLYRDLYVLPLDLALFALIGWLAWKCYPGLRRRAEEQWKFLTQADSYRAKDIRKLPVPNPSVQELEVWSGAYKKRPQTVKYAVERRKRA